MSTTRLNEIIRGKRGISADTAWQLGDWRGTGPEVWMDLQSQGICGTRGKRAGRPKTPACATWLVDGREIWRKFEGRAPIGYSLLVRIAHNAPIPAYIRTEHALASTKI